MRKKYERCGAEAFDLHQLLEMLLFHSLRREDTNPLAHKILEKHPNVAIDIANSHELTDVEGIGDVTANLLHIATDTTLAVLTEGLKRTPMDGEFARKQYLWLWYKNKPGKRVAVLILDSKNRFLECKEIVVKSGNMPKSYETEIIKAIERNGAKSAILCHRHKDNKDTPSVEDIYLTGYLKRGLKSKGYDLTAHYIITDTDCIECPSCEV